MSYGNQSKKEIKLENKAIKPVSSGIELDLIDLSHIPELQQNKNFQEEGSALSGILRGLDKNASLSRVLHTFSGQIEEINRIIKMKYASTKDIAEVILKDVALSSRVLNLVNSSFYGQFTHKGISSIPEAMVILGTEEVKQAAASLLLFDFMRDISKSEMLKEKSLAGLMRGMMAKEIAAEANYKDYDEFQICAMLYDIGEQIILFCRPDDYKTIEKLSMDENIDMEVASKNVLGTPFTEIGSAIASKWGFPPSVIETIQVVDSYHLDPKNLCTKHLKILVSSFTNELSNIDWRFGEKQRMENLERTVIRYGDILEIGMQKAERLLNTSIERIEKHAKQLRLNLRKSRFDRQFLPDKFNEAGMEAGMGQLSPSPVSSPSGAFSSSNQAEDNENKITWVENQVKIIHAGLSTHFKLSEVLLGVIKTIHQGFFFSRISICIMNRQKNIMAVRLVLGDELKSFGPKFNFKVLDKGKDVFNKALTTGLDMIVEDTRDTGNKNWIPGWYQRAGFADAFCLFPLIVEGKRVGLIYVDWKKDQTHFFSDDVKRLMGSLRRLIEKAIRKSRTQRSD